MILWQRPSSKCRQACAKEFLTKNRRGRGSSLAAPVCALSVNSFVGFLFKQLKNFDGIRPSGPGEFEYSCILAFAFDKPVDEVIAKANASGIVGGVGVKNLLDIGPDNGAQTHRARIAGGVELAAGQIIGAKLVAGRSDGLDFRVAGGVIFGQHLIMAAPDDFSVFDNDGTERTAFVCLKILATFFDGCLHKSFFFHNDSHLIIDFNAGLNYNKYIIKNIWKQKAGGKSTAAYIFCHLAGSRTRGLEY